jgi:predicted HTH domain antitoxin
MNAITLEYPDSWLVPMATDALHFAKDAKMAAAVKLFEVGKLTSGQAAQFAGVGRQDFLLGCRQWGVDSVNWDSEEIEAEFSTPLPGQS